MYCASCGVAVAQGLSYCNYCGAKLSGAKGDRVGNAAGVRPESLIATMAAMFIFGLGGITLLMGMMKSVLGLPVERVLAIALVPFLLMLVLEGVFIRLLLRRNPGIADAGDTVLPQRNATKELDAAEKRSLAEPVPSVTDHTTRTLEPVFSERKSK